MNNTNISIIISVITSIAALITSIVGIIGTKNYRSQAVFQFFKEIEDEKFIAIRKEAYQQAITQPKDERASYVINFFHKWGHMTRLHYLPLKVFNSASGIAVIRLYNLLRPYILENRKYNKLYAENFEWLYNQIRRKYKFDDTI